MSEIEQLNSRVVYRNKWMTVREDRIKRKSGAEGIYGVVDKPHFVVIIPYENGKIHLVQQFRYPVKSRFWEFPQGSWEQEPNKKPEQVAIGELKEETGLVANEMIYVGFQFQGYGYSSQGFHIYFATALTKGDTKLEVEEEDLVSSEFSIKEFEEMLLSGEIKDATTTCAYSLAKMKGLF